MASFLPQIRMQLAKGFKGKLLTGTLTRQTSSTVDEYGDPVPGTPLTFSIEGVVDEYSDFYRTQAGIPESDSKIILIAGLCETEPLKEDNISFPGFPTFQVRKVMTDPAKAHYECQSFEVQ